MDRRAVDVGGDESEVGLWPRVCSDGEYADGRYPQFHEPDAFLLFAGDTPSSTAYGVHRVTIPAGKYNVLVGTYSAQGESVTVYRLKPSGT